MNNNNVEKRNSKICPKCGQPSMVKKLVFEDNEWKFVIECENPCCKDMEYGLL